MAKKTAQPANRQIDMARVKRLYWRYRGNMERPAEEAFAHAISHDHFLRRWRPIIDRMQAKQRTAPSQRIDNAG